MDFSWHEPKQLVAAEECLIALVGKYGYQEKRASISGNSIGGEGAGDVD